MSEFSDRISLAPLHGQKSENQKSSSCAKYLRMAYGAQWFFWLSRGLTSIELNYMPSLGEAEVWPFALWLARALRFDSQGVKRLQYNGYGFRHHIGYSYVTEFFVSSGSVYRLRRQLTG